MKYENGILLTISLEGVLLPRKKSVKEILVNNKVLKLKRDSETPVEPREYSTPVRKQKISGDVVRSWFDNLDKMLPKRIIKDCKGNATSIINSICRDIAEGKHFTVTEL
jgi:hypothetical protein